VAEAVSPRERRLDLVGAIVVIAIGAFALFVARKEPPAHYDPLGPGTAPTVVSLLLLALGIILLLRAWSGLRTGQATQSMILGLDGEEPTDYRLRPRLAVFAYVATAAYTAALGFGVPFYAATIVFLIGLGAAMADFRRKRTIWVVGVGIVGAFVVKYLFGTVLLVSLP